MRRSWATRRSWREKSGEPVPPFQRVAPGLFLRYGLWLTLVNAPIAAVLLVTTAFAAGPVRIVAFGDSLTAGYGLSEADSFPTRLQEALTAHGIKAEVVNAGVSGDTTAGGRARIDWALKEHADAFILELGANDGLRGLDPKETFANLDAVMDRLDAAKIPVLIAGMKAPPNLGRDYGAEFESVYSRLAEKHHAPLYPFFLDGVAADPKLTQADGLHPTAEGAKIIAERISPYVLRLIGARE